MHCPPPPTLEVLESVLAKRGLGLRRELVTPSVRTQQCSLSRDQRRCATCAMRAALAVCERFQHESSSPCYRSSGGWVECSRLSESAASCGATSSADTTSLVVCETKLRSREARALRTLFSSSASRSHSGLLVTLELVPAMATDQQGQGLDRCAQSTEDLNSPL